MSACAARAGWHWPKLFAILKFKIMSKNHFTLWFIRLLDKIEFMDPWLHGILLIGPMMHRWNTLIKFPFTMSYINLEINFFPFCYIRKEHVFTQSSFIFSSTRKLFEQWHHICNDFRCKITYLNHISESHIWIMSKSYALRYRYRLVMYAYDYRELKYGVRRAHSCSRNRWGKTQKLKASLSF